ncbi:MAG TPA: division/cell wall cluster transcriptional repressor MraZ [Burkholderiales bacterium]|nr:division/cell wall cluster transcriptional repressor MraZ [Betaproteobacteria bacterium]HQR51744.1 division/cell wall cluster transcriptional repressor MraZ [Burkholderiales bacterium]
MFQGAAALNMDAKGRIAVPTRHREALTRDADGRLVLTAHPEGCLLLYPGSSWEPVRTKVMGFPSFNTLASKWKRLLVGFAEDIELDSAGRVLISPELRNFARLDKRVMMVGQGSHFEIWAQDAWERQLAELTAQPEQSLPPGMEDFAL